MSTKLAEIKQTFTETMNTSSWWVRHIGSQFAEYLCLFLAKIVERLEQASSRSLQESFLTLATSRTSILSGAESAGYAGRKASPSKGFVTLTNTTGSRLPLAEHAQCVASNQMHYTIMPSVILEPNQAIECELWQFEVKKISLTIDEEIKWRSVTFPQDLTDSIAKIIVRVNGVEWQHSFKFRNTNSKSLAYMEYYKSTDQWGVRFGNGINGMVPSVGDVIEFELWLTDGETTLFDGQKLELVDTADLVAVSKEGLSIVTSSSIVGGAASEDIESIRNAALYSPIYDEQLAWDSDYLQFISRNIAGVTWLSVWGEAEQEALTDRYDLANINTIFISAYSSSKSDDQVGREILELFNGREGYNEKYKLVTRKESTCYVEVTGFVHDNYDAQWVNESVTNRLAACFGKDATDKKVITSNAIWREIEALSVELGISKFDVKYFGLIDNVPVDTYHFLDTASSTVNFGYNK